MAAFALSLFFHRVVVEMTTTLFEARKALRELACVVPRALTSWILQLFVCFTLPFFWERQGHLISVLVQKEATVTDFKVARKIYLRLW